MQIILGLVLVIVAALLLLVILIGIFFFFDAFLDLPYVATKKEKIDTIIKLAQIKKGQTVVDLGSGDGRLLFESARRGVFAVGYEINPFLIGLTKIKWFFLHLRGEKSSHLGGVIVRRQSLWNADLAVADVIFVYGRKKTMAKFEDFVFKNTKKGTRVVVNTNPFPTKRPTKSINGVFLYRV